MYSTAVHTHTPAVLANQESSFTGKYHKNHRSAHRRTQFAAATATAVAVAVATGVAVATVIGVTVAVPDGSLRM